MPGGYRCKRNQRAMGKRFLPVQPQHHSKPSASWVTRSLGVPLTQAAPEELKAQCTGSVAHSCPPKVHGKSSLEKPDRRRGKRDASPPDNESLNNGSRCAPS